jgi:excinuclease ABC subunit A
VCQRCNGYAFILDDDPRYPVVDAQICPYCNGSRFIPPVSGIHFRGLTLGQLYNDTISNLLPILKALPKTRDTIALCEALGLLHLALGTPLALLEQNEQRLVLLAQAILRSTATKPVTIMLEDSDVGFTAEQYNKLETLVETKALMRHAVVITDPMSESNQGPL